MTGRIEQHHVLEMRLNALRMLRAIKSPEYSVEREDRLLDEGEALWYQMTLEERGQLEKERRALTHENEGVLMDVPEDVRLRTGVVRVRA